MTTANDIARKLQGIEYPPDHDPKFRPICEEAKAAGLVICYGASDDLLEFEGAVYDEVGAYDGTTVLMTPAGLHQNKCDDEQCPNFDHNPKNAMEIKAVFSPEQMPGTTWLIDTAIPHAAFSIMEDGDVFCSAIVFALADVKP